MKCSIILVISVLSAIYLCFTDAVPVQNGMVYYQAPMMYYNPRQYHRTMMLQYEQPSYRARTAQASEVAAFAAGDTIGAGTYYHAIEEPQGVVRAPVAPVPQRQEEEQPLDDGSATSIAEAFPDEEDAPIAADEIPAINQVLQEDEPAPELELPKKKAPRDFVPIVEENVEPSHDAQPVEPAAVVPAAPPKRKVRVELDEHDEDDDYVPFAKRPSKQNNNDSQPQWPTFFPMNFGSTSGGAIAVANSFSTGKGGTATSHATAYGSAKQQRERKRLVEETK